MQTIVIPSFNQAKYLPEAIESALSQWLPGEIVDRWYCPIIIVDDGSTDGSLEIAKSYAKQHSQIKVISQVNKGLASARNTGIMNSTTDYCLFLDADDILLDDCVKKIDEVIKGTNADIIAPSFKEFGLGQREVILGNPTLEDFKSANRIGYCSAIKREALLEVGGYNPKMVWGAEDYDLWFDLLKRGKKLVTIPKILWLYRIKANSMWIETQKHYDDFMKQIKTNHHELFR